MNWSAVDSTILLPAFLAGLLVLATHVPLGSAGAEPRHRLHRPGDRADRRARRDRRRPDRPRARRLAGAGRGRARGRSAGALLLTWTEKRGRRCRKRRSASCSSSPRPAASCCWRRIRTAASTCATCWPGRSCGSATASSPCPLAVSVVTLARAVGPARAALAARLLSGVRARGDGVGAAGRRLPGVRDADRSRPRLAPPSAARAAACSPT